MSAKGPLVQMAEYADACYEASINPMRKLVQMKASGELDDNGDGTMTWNKPKRFTSLDQPSL